MHVNLLSINRTVCHMQAVGASVRIFELLDRKSLVKDGQIEAEPFKGGMIHVKWILVFSFLVPANTEMIVSLFNRDYHRYSI